MTELDKLNKILGRLSKKCKNMLIITDCTSSMEPYGAEVALWHLLQDTSNTVKNFVFFNDGDGIPTKDKVVGKTGGIHFADPKNPQEVINTIRMVNVMGKGNDDGPENDAEAVLKAIRMAVGNKVNIRIDANMSWKTIIYRTTCLLLLLSGVD